MFNHLLNIYNSLTQEKHIKKLAKHNGKNKQAKLTDYGAIKNLTLYSKKKLSEVSDAFFLLLDFDQEETLLNVIYIW